VVVTVVAAGVSGTNTPFTTAQRASRKGKSTLVQSSEAHYKVVNPLVASTESLVVPWNGPAEHNGLPCEPNEHIIQVARYGRIYKRKTACTSAHTLRCLRDTPPGTRYCRFCNGYLPLSAFYTHIKRFVCKRHHAERKYGAEHNRAARDRSEPAVEAMLLELKNHADTLGYRSLEYDMRDLRSLLIHAGIPLGMGVRLLPIDPALPLRPRNVAIVGGETFRLIMQGYAHMCSRALYIAAVQHSNLLPPHMDPGWPENPLHDANYRRQTIDVGPLLQAELHDANGAPECVDRTRIEALLHAEPRAPWIEHAESRVPLTIAMRARWGLHRKRLAAASAVSEAPPTPLEEAAPTPSPPPPHPLWASVFK
jgi:hypothetical protein